MEILKLDNISSGYSNKEILKNVSFKVQRGEFIGVIGPNGAGKSTLMKTVTRVIKPFKGQIYLNNKNIYCFNFKEIARRIACVRQESFISFSYKVRDIVMMGRFPYQSLLAGESKEDVKVVNEMLKLTDCDKLSDREILNLSSGEKQRVVIARALAQEPEILFLDEPTSYLDIGHQMQIFNLLKKLNKEKNITIISILHDLNLAAEYCDKLLLLNNGEIIRYDLPSNVLDYKLLEEIYNTLVVVKENPISNKPYVVLVSGNRQNK